MSRPTSRSGEPKAGASKTGETSGDATVTTELAGGLVDGVVRALFGLSWGRARELVRRGKIKIDGRVVTSETLRVHSGSIVSLDLAARDPKIAKEALPDDSIVHADAHVIVVDKPSGISTVPYAPEGMGASIAQRARSAKEQATLDQRVRSALSRRERSRGGPPPELGIVHRLDKETSGLLVFTRSWAAKRALSQAFRAHDVHRRYLALVHGIPEDGTIVSHFVENRGDGLRGSVERRGGRNHAVGSEKTQRAVTHVEVVEAFHASGAGQPCSLVACRLETGRTHQIRIHLAEDGHPVLGERVYTRGTEDVLVPAPRVMLHAAELGFVHPASGETMRWTAEIPADMNEMLMFLRGGTKARAPDDATE